MVCDRRFAVVLVLALFLLPACGGGGGGSKNRPPVANPQTLATDEDTPLNITLTGTDPEGRPLTFSIGTPPASGALSGTPPVVTYTPDQDYVGPDSFVFVANDGKSNSLPATVSITVNPVNDYPVADPQSVVTDEDVPLAIVLTGTDVDGDPLTYNPPVTLPSNGSLSGTPPNLTYTPNADFNGTDGFSFTVNDGTVDSLPAAITITVNPVNDDPVAMDDLAQTLVNTPVDIDVLANDTDIDGGVLSVASVTQGANGATTINANDTVNYAPGLGFTGQDTFDYTADDGAGGQATAQVRVNVCDEIPDVYFVDPPVHYSGMTIEARVYTASLSTMPASVSFIRSGSLGVSTTFTWDLGSPEIVIADVPVGLGDGLWSVEVVNVQGCSDVLVDAVLVSSDTRHALEDIIPSWAYAGVATPVTLTAMDPMPPDLADFQPIPRAYLVDPMGSAGTPAIPLRALEHVDSKEMRAVVPETVPVGIYDVVVVNPDGRTGILSGALRVLASPPPAIDAIVPEVLDDAAPWSVEIHGADFDPGGVSVIVRCQDSLGGITSIAGAVTSVLPTVVNVDVDTTALGIGDCVFEVYNGWGGSDSYSGVSILAGGVVQPSAWIPVSSLNDARRAGGLVTGRVAGEDLFIYTIGGDDGTPAGAMTSVESARVGTYGDLGPWKYQRNDLPFARTLAGVARVGEFLYVVGGHDGTFATNTTYRAQILSPDDVPTNTDGVLRKAGAPNPFSPGTYHYLVSATFPPTDPKNPGGEGLPGEPVLVTAPVGTDVEVVVTWDPVPGADGYRVYRTPMPNLPPTMARLLGPTVGTSILDDGAVTVNELPFEIGDLGVWHATASLGTPREGLAVASIEDPNTAGEWFLYAGGGRDDLGAYLDTYEFLTITVQPDGSHAVGAWTAGADTLGQTRADCGAWVVRGVDSTEIPADSTWVFFGPGRLDDVTESPAIDAGYIDALSVSGDLGTLAPMLSFSPNRAAAAFFRIGDALYLYGGSTVSGGLGPGLQDGRFSRIVAGPALGGWSILSPTLSEGRLYPGSAMDRALVYVAGGTADGSTVNGTVDRLRP